MTLLATLGPHASFIVAAYCVGAAVVVALILWIAFDYAAQRRALAALADKGFKRGGVTRGGFKRGDRQS